MELHKVFNDGSFKMLSRDANLISGVWRLASVDEVKRNFEEIKGILEKGSIVRLLDGWVTGSGSDYKLKEGYNGGMTDMLVVQANKLRPSDGTFDPEMYSGVELTAQGREAAVLLSADDKITEAVYLVFYLYAKDAERLDQLIVKIKVAFLCFVIPCLSLVLPLRLYLSPWKSKNC